MSNDTIINFATTKIVDENCTSYERYFNQFDKSKLFLKTNESYRLTVNCSITNFAKTYELNITDSNPVLLVQEFFKSSEGKRIIGLYNEESFNLTRHQLSTLQSTFTNNCFWTMQSEIEKDKDYLDGSQYALEGVNGFNNCTTSKYHMVSRLSPDSSSFLKICEEFFKIDSLNLRNVKEW